jgi:AcrR family transcriptional regulator
MTKRSTRSRKRPSSSSSQDVPPLHAAAGPFAAQALPLRDLRDLPPEWQPPDPASPRGRILAAARTLFAEHGLTATTTRAIAARAKVNLAMIHYYYGSKEALYERVLAQEFIVVVQGMTAQLPPDLPEHEIIMTLPIRIMSVLRHNPTWITLLRHEVGLGGAHVLKALKSLGGLGPLGLRQFFDQTYAQAVACGRLRALPVNPLRECLLALAWGTVLMQPFFEQMFQSNLFDESKWAEYQQTLDALLRRGLQVENET